MMRCRGTLRVAVLTIAMVIATSLAHAQSGDDLREAAQNPIADLISLPFQNNTNFGVGQLGNNLHARKEGGLLGRPLADYASIWPVIGSGSSSPTSGSVV